MDKLHGEPRSIDATEAYVPPDLIVHGSIKELTQGSVSGTPDIGAQGSQLV
jgi:hypothetical protein